MCPDAEIISAYLDHEIESPWKERITAHLQSCPECQHRFQELMRVRRELVEDEDPDYLDSQRRLEQKLAYHFFRPAREPVWRRNIELPLPVVALAAAFLLFFGISLLIFTSRSNFRKMSIKREPSGTTQVEVSAPIEDLEQLLKVLDNQVFKQEIIITLPEDSQFNIAGEPEVIREANFSRK